MTWTCFAPITVSLAAMLVKASSQCFYGFSIHLALTYNFAVFQNSIAIKFKAHEDTLY